MTSRIAQAPARSASAMLLAAALLTLWVPLVGAVAFVVTTGYSVKVVRRPLVTALAIIGSVVAIAAAPGIFLSAGSGHPPVVPTAPR